MTASLAQKLYALEQRLARVEKGQRYAHGGSLENSSLQVRDGSGSLRAIVGQQSDGTTAVNVVNGAAPPTPSTPTVAPALGGIAVGWDGTFADGAQMPLDWSRIEVHASTADGFTPTADTLQATMETPQGAICYLPADDPTYVRLMARNTSGTASPATAQAGPYSPRPVAGDIGIGEIVETMISDGAVTSPKIFANAVTTAKLAAGSVDATALKADAITGKTITGGSINGTTVTGGLIQTASSGQRITLNEANANKVIVYNSSGVAIGELSNQGLLVKGTGGAVLWMDPNAVYPSIRYYNAANSNRATSQVVEPTTGDANLEQFCGPFTGSGFTDMVWRSYLGRDFASMERLRATAPSTVIGGRVVLQSDEAHLEFKNSADATQDTGLTIQANSAVLQGGRFTVQPPASGNSALYVEAATGHTGNLLRLFRDGTDRFKVDKDGNTTVDGLLTAKSIVTGSVSITPVANTPTSVTVSGLNLPGTVHRAFVTAQSSVPGTVVECTATSVTATGLTIWVNRTNTTNTNIWYLVIAS